MNYIDDLAVRIHQAAEPDAPPHEDILLYRIYAVLALAKGEKVTAEDVHNAWAVWAAEYDPQHRALVPFDELPPRIRELDGPYVAAIHAVAHDIGVSSGN